MLVKLTYHKLQHIIETTSIVINDYLLHSCPQLSRITWNHCLRHCIICCHSENLQTTTRHCYL